MLIADCFSLPTDYCLLPTIPLRISSPFKTLREKLAPKNPVFLEKNALREMPISKNPENKRKTTIGVLEKGKITLENSTVSQEFVKAMISKMIKKD